MTIFSLIRAYSLSSKNNNNKNRNKIVRSFWRRLGEFIIICLVRKEWACIPFLQMPGKILGRI